MRDWLPFLLDSAIKGVVVLGLAGLAASWLRRGSAASRHLVWHIAVLGLLALPIVSAALPAGAHWAVLPRIGVDHIGVERTVSQQSQDVATNDNEQIFNATSDAALPSVSSLEDAARSANDVDGDVTSRTEPAAARSGGFHLPQWPVATWLFVIWLTGAALVLARYALGTLVVHWFTWRSRPVDAIEWASLNETMSFAVGLGHPVRLLKSERAATPMTFGVLNPVVLLPGDADEWNEERRRVVLLHELAHVQRLDSLTNIFATLACAVYWFNPLVWMAVGRMRAEGERACDDWVLRAGMRASTYAEHLLDMVKTIGRLHTPAAALPMAQRSTFEGRLLAILEPGMNRNGTRRGQALLLTIVIGVVVLPLAAMTSPAAATKSAETTADAVANTTIPIGTALTHLGSKVGLLPEKASTHADPAKESAAALKDALPGWSEQEADVVSDNTIRSLIGALGDADLEVRRESIRTLGQLGDARSVAALSNALRTDKDASVRRAAAWALGQIGDEKGVPALADALKSDSDMIVRRTAAWAVGQIGDASATDALTAAVRDNDKELRSTAVWALGQIGESAGIPALAISIRDSDASIRNESAWALGQIGEEAGVAALKTALADSDEQVRSTAVWALGQIGEESSASALASMMKDASASVRSDAAWALGQISERHAPQPLIDAVRDANVDVRRNVVWALGQIQDPASSTALRTAMKDADPDVKRGALRALARIGDDSALDAISEMLKDPDPAVRKQAAQMLGGHGFGMIDPRPRPRPQPRPRPFGW